MKRLTKIVLPMLLALASAGAAARTIEMHVNGLVCAFCAQGIEKAMKRLDPRAEVWVSLENRMVAVKLKDGMDIPDATLKKSITDAGYTLVKVERSERTLDQVRAEFPKK